MFANALSTAIMVGVLLWLYDTGVILHPALLVALMILVAVVGLGGDK